MDGFSPPFGLIKLRSAMCKINSVCIRLAMATVMFGSIKILLRYLASIIEPGVRIRFEF